MEPDELVDEIPLRRSQRVHRSIISNDYMFYLQEHECNVSRETDPITFSQTVSSANSLEWMNVMKDDLVSM